MSRPQNLLHPRVTRRTAVQAGAIGMLGLGSNHLQALQAADVKAPSTATAKCCIYIFLSGGLSQHDSFAPNPMLPRKFAVSSVRSPPRQWHDEFQRPHQIYYGEPIQELL